MWKIGPWCTCVGGPHAEGGTGHLLLLLWWLLWWLLLLVLGKDVLLLLVLSEEGGRVESDGVGGGQLLQQGLRQLMPTGGQGRRGH